MSVFDHLDPEVKKKIDEFNVKFDNSMLHMQDQSEQIFMDTQSFLDITNDNTVKDKRVIPWLNIFAVDDEQRFLHMPFQPLNQLRKGFTLDYGKSDFGNYLTIMELSYACPVKDKAMRLPSLYALMSQHFSRLVKDCLTH